MKSKSFDLKQAQDDKSKLNKTFDFVGFYKSAADTEKNLPEKRKLSDTGTTESPKSKQETPKRGRSPYKNRKKSRNELVDLSHISIDGSNLNSSVGPSTPRNDPKITSTPYTNARNSASFPVGKVKSIMKATAANQDDTMDGTKRVFSNPKKRNKSVSFMLDENEEVVVKRTKSEDSITNKNNKEGAKIKLKDQKKQLKKLKKERLSEKENKLGDINQNVEKSKEKYNKKKIQADMPTESVASENQTEVLTKKKKVKKIKKEKKEIEDDIQTNTEITSNEENEPQAKKVKKKKHKTKTDSDGEPVMKSRKKDVIKPDVIAEDLENLSIGDNAHTLSSLLDEMTVADKTKRVKSKSKHKEKKKALENNNTPPQDEEKEKIKWKKRKWNKDKKGEVNTESLATSVIVENLPISIMLTYKKILADHFAKCGLIKRIGVAEMYPTEEATPVFTTVINFYSDGAATQALEEDNVLLEGSHIRLKRPLPATETTLVLRSYADLNEQNICTLFVGAGKIRNIRHMVKGKKAMSTAFVEFDGPKSVKKALKIANGAKVGGKKVHIAKFQIRTHKTSKSETAEEDKPDEEKNEDTND